MDTLNISVKSDEGVTIDVAYDCGDVLITTKDIDTEKQVILSPAQTHDLQQHLKKLVDWIYE